MRQSFSKASCAPAAWRSAAGITTLQCVSANCALVSRGSSLPVGSWAFTASFLFGETEELNAVPAVIPPSRPPTRNWILNHGQQTSRQRCVRSDLANSILSSHGSMATVVHKPPRAYAHHHRVSMQHRVSCPVSTPWIRSDCLRCVLGCMRNAPRVVIFQSLTKQFGKPDVIPVRLAQRPKYVNVVKTSHTKKPSLSRSPPSPIC